MDASILYIEDDPDDAFLIGRQLESKRPEWKLTWVSDKAAFQEALAKNRVDVILSDYQLPGTSGDEVLGYVAWHYPHIPVVILSGGLGPDHIAETLTRGAADYVLKSNLPRLVPSIERILEKAGGGPQEGHDPYRTLFENGPLPSWMFDLGTLQILEVNQAAIGALGYTREELLSLGVDDLWAEEEGRFRWHIGALVANRRADFQSRYRRKDGATIEAAIHWSTLDQGGRRVCIASMNDVTELARLRDNLSRELAGMKHLHELGRRLLREDDPEALLRGALTAAMELMGAQKGDVQLFDEEAQALTIRTSVGFSRLFLDHFRVVPVGRDCACGQALARQERLVLENVFEDESYHDLWEPFREEGISACISTPMIGRGGRAFGMLSVHFARPHKPAESELSLLDLYVDQAARVLELREATF